MEQYGKFYYTLCFEQVSDYVLLLLRKIFVCCYVYNSNYFIQELIYLTHYEKWDKPPIVFHGLKINAVKSLFYLSNAVEVGCETKFFLTVLGSVIT